MTLQGICATGGRLNAFKTINSNIISFSPTINGGAGKIKTVYIDDLGLSSFFVSIKVTAANGMWIMFTCSNSPSYLFSYSTGVLIDVEVYDDNPFSNPNSLLIDSISVIP